MKTCKKGLHQYAGKQCDACQLLWRIESRPILSPKKSAYDKANREHQNELRRIRRAANPSKYKDLDKQGRKRHQAKRTATQTKRQAAKLQRTPKWLTKVQLQQITMFYEAASLLTKEFGFQMEVDHIVPLKGLNVSGLHVPWNLQVIGEKENMSKGNRF